MTALGLGAGFGMMFGGHDDGAKFFLALVPIGFLLGFTGAVTAIVTSPRSTGTPER